MAKLAVIGAGMMGEALTRGMLAAGWRPDDIVLVDVREARLRELSASLHTPVSTDPSAAVRDAEGVLLAVKPQDIHRLLAELSDGLGPSTGVVSIVAGIRIDTVEAALGDNVSVVRAMPNTPARVGTGVTALSAGQQATDATRTLADGIFSAVGPVVWLPEHQLDAVTALSASGPAYVFLVAEAMVDAGVALGLPRDVASTLAFQTIEGAGRMLTQTGEHPAVLRGQVTSPAGTTAAGVSVLEAMAVRAAFIEAIRTAHRRSVELG